MIEITQKSEEFAGFWTGLALLIALFTLFAIYVHAGLSILGLRVFINFCLVLNFKMLASLINLACISS